MLKRVCDKCGRDIIHDTKGPIVQIEYMEPKYQLPIDLCQSCTKDLEDWLKKK